MEQNLKFISQAEVKLIRETSIASKDTDNPEPWQSMQKKKKKNQNQNNNKDYCI